MRDLFIPSKQKELKSSDNDDDDNNEVESDSQLVETLDQTQRTKKNPTGKARTMLGVKKARNRRTNQKTILN